MTLTVAPSPKESSITDNKLWWYNFSAGSLHLVQGGGMMVAAFTVPGVKDFSKTLTRSYLVFNPETKGLEPRQTDVVDVYIAQLAAVFLLLSWFSHFFVLSVFKVVYLPGINKGINHIRWYEYWLSSSVMICAIWLLFGCYDLGSHILLFLVNASMNLFGLLMEKMNGHIGADGAWGAREMDGLVPGDRLEQGSVTSTEQQSKGCCSTDWTAFVYGCVAGSAGWILMGLYFFGGPDIANVPGFVIGILFSYVFFFNTFPVNMWLQYAKIGAWKDYRYGELWYMILSLASKSLLAWLVFGGTFQPNGKTDDDKLML